MVFALGPHRWVVLGVGSITVPWDTLLRSVVLYMVIPVIIGQVLGGRVLAKGRSVGALAFAGPAGAVLACRLPDDAGAVVRLAGGADPGSTAGHSPARRADPNSGLFQRRAGLLAEPAFRGRLVRCGTVSADRSVKLLRAGRRCRNLAIRHKFRRSLSDSGRSLGRGAGHALRRRDREADARLV